MRPAACGRCALLALSFLLVSPALAEGPAPLRERAEVAALQVGLSARRLYDGPIDGISGAETNRAVRALQRQARLRIDGVVGPATRAALGPFAGPELGGRAFVLGDVGWDVAQLQFLLAWHGFPSRTLDGSFGPRTRAALYRFQRWAGLPPGDQAGPATRAALSALPPVSVIPLLRPLDLPIADGFGPRGNRFHTGIDIPAPLGTAVSAAGPGRVAYAGWHPGGWGYLVSIAHAGGARSMYAHLSRVDVRVGRRVAAGSAIGTVGATGAATAPHLHFEVRLRGAAVDPVPALG